MAERDLDAALVALVETALRRATEAEALAPTEQARLVAHALAAGLRELIRAPLREALQAGYDLGWRAGHDARRHTTDPCAADASTRTLGDAQPHGAERPHAPPEAALANLRTADGDPHHVRVDVGPFSGFSAVNRFHAAVAAAPGVVDATIVAFRDSMLSLRVQHPDGLALATALLALDLGPLRVLAASADYVELTLDNGQSAATDDQPAERHTARAPAKGRSSSA